jgi:hypothetical protein
MCIWATKLRLTGLPECLPQSEPVNCSLAKFVQWNAAGRGKSNA